MYPNRVQASSNMMESALMKKKWIYLPFLLLTFATAVLVKDINLTIVRHRWQEKIVESNHASLRPGSIYDINTYFEQNAGLVRPNFNYYFFDTGLGATNPIYPVFQKGHQRNWGQLISAGLSEKTRHIDHSSIGNIPEGCTIQSTYWVRHVDEFPELYKTERAQGYTLVDVSFDYYKKTRPDAQCGKHFAHEQNDDFDPLKAIDGYAKSFRTLSDIPPKLLEKYEANVGIMKLITEEFGDGGRPRFNKAYSLGENSSWYYPDGFVPDYGIKTPHKIQGLNHLSKAKHLFLEARPSMDKAFPLITLIGNEGHAKLLSFWNGKPTPEFRAEDEPGDDTLDLSEVTKNNFYTSGIEIFPMNNVMSDVANPNHFKLVSVVLRPFEPESDIQFVGLRQIPQVRFVFQLMDPREINRPFEQLYLHVIFDAVDRLAAPEARSSQMQNFLSRLDELTVLREHGDSVVADASTVRFIQDFTNRPVQTIAFSSSLTGIWVFGSLSRSYNESRSLEAVRIVREGVDVGYYSSAYDTVLFRQALAKSKGSQAEKLEEVLKDLTPNFYRDPRRHDAHALSFHRVTCAQCHQMAGRDGVHVTLNDNLDRRIKTPFRATEFVFRELDRQLSEAERNTKEE